ncbi:HD domain-containing phosphohydrolase [Eubacterium xylanophilum]|uniref:HD domain-containing phosphohydrolase n=1 Tax=Eubacterium xylanophilum TaxID=39497 RepID=UPI0009FCC606|nr:HD domain-containing phosphohydrolase [Eubacterium xylanophilum]
MMSMVYENIENFITLICTVAGLLYCFSKYTERPKRVYLFLIVFFVSHLLSDYYWSIYVLVMGDYPKVSEFLAYLGWNLGYLSLFMAIFEYRREQGKYFNPIMLWPLVTNLPLLALYLRFGGIYNNIYQVGITTIIMMLCTGEILRYIRHKDQREFFPAMPLLILIFLIFEYGMWTASCFDWESELMNPYFYCSIISSVVSIFFVMAAGKRYKAETEEANSDRTIDVRFNTSVQIILAIIIFASCFVGYYIAKRIKENFSNISEINIPTNEIVLILFMISLLVVLIIFFFLYRVTANYRKSETKKHGINVAKRSRFNLIFIIMSTLILMVFAVVFNVTNYEKVAVTGLYEDGVNEIEKTAVDLENHLVIAESTLRVAADSVDLMVRKGRPSEEILDYLKNQTKRQSENFDENFTGIYAYIDGQYMDGTNWVPDAGFKPKEREWYKTAINGRGRIVMVSPYVDAQTGAIVVTIAKEISNRKIAGIPQERNVVCLDVMVGYIKSVIEKADIAGKGYGMVVNTDGFIIAHRDAANSGKNISEIKGIDGKDFLKKIENAEDGKAEIVIDEAECVLFVHPIRNQWYGVIVVNKEELLENVNIQLVVNGMVSFVTFILLSFFYFLGYKNEQNYRKRVEGLNIQIATALAAAIDAKDTYTNGHSTRVAKYSRMIAERYGYNEAELDEIYMMGLLHDVGKIGVPDGVINKTSKLTSDEFEEIKKHPVIGNRILETIEDNPKLTIGTRWHHERYEGGGYPDGIAGEDIPEEARIIAVADAYDAMTSRRSYRDTMSQEKVRAEIENGMGTQFDPVFAKIMLEMIDEDKDYTMREKYSEEG